MDETHPTSAPKLSETAANPEAAEVHAWLNRVVESKSFRSSKRSASFLRFVIEHRLAHPGEPLKERVIAAELFGRPASYDSSEDAIVRVAAHDVRRRLAQYYTQEGARDPVRVVLQQGSYTPQFSVAPSIPPLAPIDSALPLPEPTPIARWRWLAGVFLVLAVSSLWLIWPRQTHFDRFWQPMFASRVPVMLCMGHPVVYHTSKRLQDLYWSQQPRRTYWGPYILKLPEGTPLFASDMVPVQEQYIGFGDSFLASNVTFMLGKHNVQADLRIGSEVPFADIRSKPTILIGAFSNRWTLDLTKDFRFVFDRKDGVNGVREQGDKGRWWPIPEMRLDGRTPEDYAVISRLADSASGKMLLVVGGLTQFGSQAAGEIITDPSLLNEALADAPPGWERRNLQLVVHAKVIGNSPAPPQVVAKHYW
jgi:hypothetical protein